MEYYINEHFPYDEFFTDPDGNIFPLEDIRPDSSCGHDLLKGVANRHTKNSDGGCTVKKDHCFFCTQCGYGVKDEELCEGMFAICMHS